MVQGGIVIFGTDGKARYAYEEETGKDLPVDDILAAVRAVEEEKQMERKQEMTGTQGLFDPRDCGGMTAFGMSTQNMIL